MNDREKQRKAGRNLALGGNVLGIVFLILWCAAAVSMGVWWMALFGLCMLGYLVFRLVMILRLDSSGAPPKEAGPSGQSPNPPSRHEAGKERFCPYCGQKLESTFAFCPNCGRRLQ